MNMHNPAHPGELLIGWLDDLGVSVTAFAAHIGISRVMLSRVVNGHAAVSADMDLRLSEALGTNQGIGWRCKPSVTFGRQGKAPRTEAASSG